MRFHISRTVPHQDPPLSKFIISMYHILDALHKINKQRGVTTEILQLVNVVLNNSTAASQEGSARQHSWLPGPYAYLQGRWTPYNLAEPPSSGMTMLQLRLEESMLERLANCDV